MPSQRDNEGRLVPSLAPLDGLVARDEIPDQRIPDDTRLLSYEEFISLWRGKKLLLQTSDGVVPMPWGVYVARGVRTLAQKLERMKLEHNTDLKTAVRATLIGSSKLSLMHWKLLVFSIKTNHHPEQDAIPA